MKPWLDDSLAANGLPVRENFNAWFEDSKVLLDEKPLIVFHGTASDVGAFDKSRAGRNYARRSGDRGFFFTSLPGTAEVYAEQAVEPWRTKDGAPTLMPVYLRMQKPYVRQAPGSPDKWYDQNHAKLLTVADARGSDGIIVKGQGVFAKRVVYIVFEPEQIKSAIGNSGLYLKDSASLSDLQASLDLYHADQAQKKIIDEKSSLPAQKKVKPA